MKEQKTLYAVLRDGLNWDAATTGLQLAPDGTLTLAAVPGAADGQAIILPAPFDAPASGLAIGSCGDRYIADTANNRVIWLDGVCNARIDVPSSAGTGSAPAHFREPRGLYASATDLYVADSGNGRVQVFRLPTLEVRAIWEAPFQEPIGLAADSQQRVYVLDRGLRRILRFSASGALDTAYDATLQQEADFTSPAFMTLDADDTLYVTDDITNVISRLDVNGYPLGVLQPPADAAGFKPRTLICFEQRLYIADAASGRIWIYDYRAQTYLGTLPDYVGPVTALAVDQAGSLYIKDGQGETVYVLAAALAFVLEGELRAGPFDAGYGSEWLRLHVEAQVPDRAAVQLELFTGDNAWDIPVFAATNGPDLLLSTMSAGRGGNSQRYLWLRVRVTTADSHAAPRLMQIEAETAGENYLNYLPAVYARADASEGFLQRWLELFRSELGGLERTLEEMPQRFDPLTTPAELLPWLAGWLGFELPVRASIAEQRALLLRVHELYQRRGTPAGLREFIELYTGVRTLILEGFQERRVWQLGYTSLLGFDTALPSAFPDGIIVAAPSSALANGTASDADVVLVGQTVIGASVPLAAADFGTPLFSETAHTFTVFVPGGQFLDGATRAAVRQVIDTEKPAYTDYHLCMIEARMRVGFQSQIGISSIVAGPPDPMDLEGATLGVDSYLGEAVGEAGISRIGQRAYIGHTTVIT